MQHCNDLMSYRNDGYIISYNTIIYITIAFKQLLLPSEYYNLGFYIIIFILWMKKLEFCRIRGRGGLTLALELRLTAVTSSDCSFLSPGDVLKS